VVVFGDEQLAYRELNVRANRLAPNLILNLRNFCSALQGRRAISCLSWRAFWVAYQVARDLLTRQISLMRDAEERSGISPPKDDWFAYPQLSAALYRVHLVLSVIVWIATAALRCTGLRVAAGHRDPEYRLGSGPTACKQGRVERISRPLKKSADQLRACLPGCSNAR
jgi:hypothetical protein